MNEKDIDDIVAYVSQDIRNKIVFCQKDIEGLNFINVGKTLSTALQNNLSDVSNVYNLFRRIIGNTSIHNKIGKYIALENIDILFEPDLHLEINYILDSLSTNQCLIIKSDMQVIGNNLCYPKLPNEVLVNLKDFNYMIIKNQI